MRATNNIVPRSQKLNQVAKWLLLRTRSHRHLRALLCFASSQLYISSAGWYKSHLIDMRASGMIDCPVPLACTAASEGLIDRRRARGCSLRTAVITSRNSRIRRELSHTRSKHLAHQLGQAVFLVHYHNQHLKIPVGLKFSSLFNTRTASLVLL
ncbi:hypothetical protein RRG08_001666 [Elysia crispata]|uniref:Uncharacterized protein n=1 Tax=Elysia crispata TaxID=231223 RepID=A0AAE1ALC5_9GAST|nr:hypothetical protein RRG08_001666 [Elysia crispata]